MRATRGKPSERNLGGIEVSEDEEVQVESERRASASEDTSSPVRSCLVSNHDDSLQPEMHSLHIFFVRTIRILNRSC